MPQILRIALVDIGRFAIGDQRQLESSVGLELFEQLRKKIALTEAGRDIYE
ncbi:MAG: hypothetical protein ACYDC8_07715 [Gammaproteobacteria bacterium]